MQVQEQAADAQEANVDVFFNLTRAFAEGMEKLVRLNMEAARSALAAMQDMSEKALTVQAPQDWLMLESGMIEPTAGKIQAYQRQVLDIATATHADCLRCTQRQWEAYGERTRTLMQDLMKNAPSGSEPITAALGSAISAASTLYETLRQTGQQAVEVTRSNMDLVAAAASKSAKRGGESIVPPAKR